MGVTNFKKMLTSALLTCCVSFTAYASPVPQTNHPKYIAPSDQDAVFSVDMTEKMIPATRMPSIAAGKTQVMEIKVDSLKANNSLHTSGNKYLNAGNIKYYAICTSRTSGTTADVGLAYVNSKGEFILQATTSLSGVDSYGTIVGNSVYKNYGYIENTGTSTLKATYVLMK